MSISSQLPGIALSAKAGNLQSLGLRPLQTIMATVIGPGTDGTTQVQVGRQMLNMVLPTAMPPGTTLMLQAQGSGLDQRLVMTQQTPPSPTASTPSASTSPTAPSATQPATATPGTSIPATTVTTSQPVSMQPGELQSLGLRPEQIVSGRVMGPPANGATPVQVASQTVHVVLPTPVPPGATLLLQAQGQGSEQRLVILHQVPPSTQPAMVQTQATGTLSPEAQYTMAAKAAVTQMVQSSATRQDSMAGLTTALTSTVGQVALPEPVVRAAQALLATRLSLAAPAPTGTDLQRAVLNSGVFQEAMLAAGIPPRNADVKTGLLALRQSLVNWLGNAPAAPTPPLGRPAPPVRGTAPRVTPTMPSPIDIDKPVEEVGKVLLDRTEASLSRLRLHQHASLPDAPTHAQPHTRSEWTLELPVMVGTYQTMMQFQIHRDGHQGNAYEAERGWQMRFAIDLPVMGEVGAQVNLRGGITSVLLWAAQPETAALLDAELPELSRALIEAGLKPSAVHCRQGEPQAPLVASGHFMDKRT